MELISSTKLKARKDHVCDWCGHKIKKGEVYGRQFNKYDGDVYVWKNHIICAEIASELNMFDNCDEGLGEEEFIENIQGEFINIHRKLDEEYYESDRFPATTFEEELDFVIKHHLSGKKLPQICYKTNKPCKYNCSGLCKESV